MTDVCCEASDDMLLVSLFFHRACNLWKNQKIEPHISFVPSYQTLQCSTSRVPYCNDGAMRVARRLQVPTMHSKDILFQAERDNLDWVYSDQMVLEMIRWEGGWSGSCSSAEANSLKTRVKGNIWLPLQWDSSRGGQRAMLKGYSHREPIQGEPPGSSSLRSDGSCGGQAGGGSGRAVAQRPKTLRESWKTALGSQGTKQPN
jgi:hypothetical protein